jgi:hypothetical protein
LAFKALIVALSSPHSAAFDRIPPQSPRRGDREGVRHIRDQFKTTKPMRARAEAQSRPSAHH